MTRYKLPKRETVAHRFSGDQLRQTVCYCPLCERLHQKYVYYTGRGIPRIYHDWCLRTVTKYQEYENYIS